MGRPEDIRLSFNEAAETYDEVRPSYPSELFDALFQALPSQPEIVEVGPGTGQATRDLLARGATVHAIEIGPAMATRLRSNLRTDPLRVSVGDFEELTIPPASADAVFSASAYHWIAPAAQTDRPASILRPGGLVAIVDLIQVESPSDLGFFAAAQPIYDDTGKVTRDHQLQLVIASTRPFAPFWRPTGASITWLSVATTGIRPTAPRTIGS